MVLQTCRRCLGFSGFALSAVVMAVAVLFLPPIALLPILWVPYLGVVGFYLLVLFAASIGIVQSGGKLSCLYLVPLVFVAIHFGAGWGSLKELVLGKSAGDAFDR